MLVGLHRIVRLGPRTFIDGELIVPNGSTLKLIGNIDASEAVITGAVIADITVFDAQLLGTTVIENQQWLDGSEINIAAGDTVSFVGGGTLDLTGVNVIFQAPDFNDVTLTGTTTIENTLDVTANSTFIGPVTLNDQVWTDASTITIAAGETVFFEGGGTVDFSNVIAILPAPTFNNVTLLGTTTIEDQVWTNTSTITVAAGETVSFEGGGTIDFTNVNAILPAPSFNNVTLTGTTTIEDQIWTDTSTVTIAAGDTVSFQGGGTLDFSNVITILPASVFNNVTLTGTTTIEDQIWTDTSTITIAAGDTVSFQGGGTLDLTNVITILPASVFNNVTLTGTTTIQNQIWSGNSSITIGAANTISFTGGGTLDLSGVNVNFPDVITVKGLVITPQVNNPGVPANNTLWVPTSNPTRPSYGANSLALFSDLVVGGWSSVVVPVPAGDDFGYWTSTSVGDLWVLKRDPSGTMVFLSSVTTPSYTYILANPGFAIFFNLLVPVGYRPLNRIYGSFALAAASPVVYNMRPFTINTIGGCIYYLGQNVTTGQSVTLDFAEAFWPLN